MRRSGILAVLAIAVSITAPALAQTPPDEPQSSVAGWNEFIDGLRTLPDKLLGKLPAQQRSDPLVQQEMARIVLRSLTASLLESIGSDGDHPAFVANQNLTLDYPQPNADTVYRITRVTPSGTYRLRGDHGTLRLANLGQAGPMPGETGGSSLQAGPSGAFSISNHYASTSKAAST